MRSTQKQELKLGFVALTDSAPLIVAKEYGFFEEQGLDVTLQKQNSWATLRDKLHAGVLDAAQMLAPMPLASGLGLGCRPCEVIAPFVLSLNGNAITISEGLYQEILAVSGLSELPLPLSAKLLLPVIAQRKEAGLSKLKFADVFPYSCHHYQLLDWLSDGGVELDDVDLLTVPPVNMVDFLESGEIDAFCVGGPWNAKAVRSEIGLTALTSFDIWENQPEKVLGVTKKFASDNPNLVRSLCTALAQACSYLEKTPNRFEAARLMSRANYLDAPIEVIAPSLIGSCLTHRFLPPRVVPSYNQFSDAAVDINKPTREQGIWLVNKMLKANQITDREAAYAVVDKVFTDSYL
ncbi:MAG: ABC transporter substrate-binding protein [Oleiphilaceae bacterium]|nr:ABC transporter substrate-binding protein [Oleiphilaceae bacterium]